MVFPVVMYGRQSWTIKKAEGQKIDAFKLWCWKRSLRVLWTARRTNQSFLKKNQPSIFIGRTDAEAEAPILWPPDGKSQFIGKVSDAGKGGKRIKGWQRMRWLNSLTNSKDMNLSKLWEIMKERGARCAVVSGVRVGHDLGIEQQLTTTPLPFTWKQDFVSS